MSFDWNHDKARINLTKHGVSFEEAMTVFDDPLYLDFFDPDHSEDEQRYLRIGRSDQGHLLIVAYTEREDQTRIISARQATSHERKAYED